MRVVCVAGARPNFMKIAPVLVALDDAGAETVLVHTGQHYDEAMSQVFFDELDIRKPDEHLGVGSGSHAEQTARVMVAFEALLGDAARRRRRRGRRRELHARVLDRRREGRAFSSRTSRPGCAAATGRCPRRSTGSSPTA